MREKAHAIDAALMQHRQNELLRTVILRARNEERRRRYEVKRAALALARVIGQGKPVQVAIHFEPRRVLA